MYRVTLVGPDAALDAGDKHKMVEKQVVNILAKWILYSSDCRAPERIDQMRSLPSNSVFHG